MSVLAALFAALFLIHSSPAQARHPDVKPAHSAAADRLGLTCAQILTIRSTDWVAKFEKDKGAAPGATARALAVYGRCYDQRTEQLGLALRRKRSAPPKYAAADFAGFEGAVRNFTKTAVADAQPSPDAAKLAYIDLYGKQFRYEFYREYEQKDLNPKLTPEENLQFTKAKNRFAELLGLLPTDKAHPVHAAFGETVGLHQVSMAIKLALYRYAIFILEPPTRKPFAAPPF
jgi:hypothetical protein